MSAWPKRAFVVELGLTALLSLGACGRTGVQVRVPPSGMPDLQEQVYFEDAAMLPDLTLPPIVVVQIAAGNTHSCALLSDGTVRCWGANDQGQLGSPTPAQSDTAVTVPRVDQAIAIAAGDSHTCALLRDGSVMCWGSNYHGQLGDGSRTTWYIPSHVRDLTGAVELALGNSHSCARRADRVVLCWGSNDYGELGDTTLQERFVPAPVAFFAADQITAGHGFSCGLLGDAGNGKV